jgi:hypothetical protein
MSAYPVVALEQNLLRLVPVAVLHGALQVRAMVAVQVLEDPVLVLEASIDPLGRRIVHRRQAALLCPRRGDGRKASGCGGRGQGAVGGCAERRRGGGVSCEHCACGVCGYGRN